MVPFRSVTSRNPGAQNQRTGALLSTERSRRRANQTNRAAAAPLTNLSRQPEKDNAVESIRQAHEVRRHAQRALRRADVPLPDRPVERATDLVLRVYNRQRIEITDRIRHLGQAARELSQRLVHRHEIDGPGLSR